MGFLDDLSENLDVLVEGTEDLLDKGEEWLNKV